VGVTRIESNRNRHFGLKIESKSIENRDLEIVTSLNGATLVHDQMRRRCHSSTGPHLPINLHPDTDKGTCNKLRISLCSKTRTGKMKNNLFKQLKDSFPLQQNVCVPKSLIQQTQNERPGLS